MMSSKAPAFVSTLTTVVSNVRWVRHCRVDCEGGPVIWETLGRVSVETLGLVSGETPRVAQRCSGQGPKRWAAG